MTLQQFRFVRETIRRDFNLTEAARSLAARRFEGDPRV